MAGETPEEFLRVAAASNSRGFAVACGILGEGVKTAAEADDAATQYCAMLREFAARGLDANVAFKLTHVGLEIGEDLALANASSIAQTALECGNTTRMDMEQSAFVDATLGVYRKLRERFNNVGFVLQSYLKRSISDLTALLPLQPNVRIVKGAYLEPPAVAFEKKADVDASYLQLADLALSHDGYTAIATHDPKIVAHVKDRAAQLGLPKQGRFEFQMLYGIAGALGQELLREGYRVRLAIPFGSYWYPYLMRRLAERPENLAFFLRGALRR